LVFTDVEGSTDLWEKKPLEMARALELHNQILRRELARHRGYEVKTEGDSFMIAFPRVASAGEFCLAVQREMRAAAWPAGLPGAGLKVRMGIHCGEPEPKVDPLTGRMDYFGPVVNRAARVAAASAGGRVLLSAAAWEELEGVSPVSALPLGPIALKGLPEPERLVELLSPAA